MELTDKNQLLQYLKSHGLWAKKGLGQNFLVDKNALDKIVEAADLKDSDFIIEIGPGVGTLTQELVRQAGEVITIEKDEKLAELLCQQFKIYNPPNSEAGLKFKINDQLEKLKGQNNTGYHSEFISESRNNKMLKQVQHDVCDTLNLKIINADILKVNLDEIIGSRKYKVVANIPYYITSKILELFLSRENKPEAIVLLIQKEVAERICAREGGMSVLSVSVQLYGKPEIAGIVPASSFFPAPKVDSAILRISNIAAHPKFILGSDKEEILKQAQILKQVQDDTKVSVQDDKCGVRDDFNEKSFFRCVHIGFASRRKTLANNLSAGYHIDKGATSDIIKEMGLKETVRAQELSIHAWRELCRKMETHQK